MRCKYIIICLSSCDGRVANPLSTSYDGRVANPLSTSYDGRVANPLSCFFIILYYIILYYIMIKSQDDKQKIEVAISFLFQLYRVVVSSFLILFVPQKCDNDLCSYSDNLESDNNTYTFGLAMNFFTMLIFLMLYMVELNREKFLIKYLEVNDNLPYDNESVEKALEKIDSKRKNKLWKLDYYYQNIGKISIFSFITNSVVSSVIIYDYYLDNQTTTTLVTNILFMATKIYDVYVTVYTDKNIFYSAYLQRKLQFNDVDPQKMITIEPSAPEIYM
jgi:hypothetical protein